MPQSLTILYVHAVFSTEARRPLLHEAELRARMHAYLAGTSRGLGCPAVSVGGPEDHVHMLVRFNATICVADWVREVKKSSNSWVRTQGSSLAKFAWQAGYGAFSTDATRIPELRRYVENQEEHHRKISFRDELHSICEEAGVEFDEEFLMR